MIKSAFRSLMKNKGFTLINVLGLALGLAVCLLIVFYVVDELNYDTYNSKADRIYRINDDIKFGGSGNSYAVSAAPLAAAMTSEFPEVEGAVRFRERGSFKVKKGDQNVQEHRMIFADPSLFNVFTLPLIAGSSTNALTAPKTVVINETTAKKYFNTVNAVGKTMVFNDSLLYKVTAVIQDIPKQSHFNYDFFLSMTSLPESKQEAWLSNNFNTYILLKKGASASALSAKFPAFIKNHLGAQLQTIVHLSFESFEKGGNYFRLGLIPLEKIHLYSNRVAELGSNGNIQYVYIFSAIAIFILLIACVNFMNLSTARSANRAREVGVRKVLGSPRKYLVMQFLSESVMITLIATITAIIAAVTLLPLFNQMAGKELAVDTQTWVWLIPVSIFLVVFIGCIAGAYPALFLSGFQPVKVLKGRLSAGFKGGGLRSFLVVFQFSISILLIIGTLVVYHQLKYIQSKDLGYKRDQVIILQNTYVLGNEGKLLKDEIRRLPGVLNTTMTSYLPTEGMGNSTAVFQEPTMDAKKAFNPQFWPVDEDYIPTLGMKLVAGRNFSKEMKTDSSAVIINETAAKQLVFTDPLNKLLYVPMDSYAKVVKPLHIIGIIKDFNFHSLRENVTPMLLTLSEDRGAIAVLTKTADLPLLLKQIKDKWKSVSPNQQLNYSFMDNDFDSFYRDEQRIGKIAIAFSAMAIAIACLGLFGLAAYAAEQRTKEIGIRKVLGADISAIVALLSKDFIVLVLVAIGVASPVAWYLMNQWLQGYAYRVNIGWWIFASAGFGALVIAFITISFQSVKAAMLNPVKSLKSE